MRNAIRRLELAVIPRGLAQIIENSGRTAVRDELLEEAEDVLLLHLRGPRQQVVAQKPTPAPRCAKFFEHAAPVRRRDVAVLVPAGTSDLAQQMALQQVRGRQLQ